MNGERIPSKTVLVDMDGVLADFDRAVLDRLPSSIARVARMNFYIAEDYPEHVMHVRSIVAQPDFFQDLPIVEGAIDGWERLLDLGYDPRICSAPLSVNSFSAEGKRLWLQRHFVPKFGEQVVSRAIIDKQKYKYAGRVLIDDRPKVDTGNGQAAWQHVVFDRPYNADSDAKYRLMDWYDDGLESILDAAA